VFSFEHFRHHSIAVFQNIITVVIGDLIEMNVEALTPKNAFNLGDPEWTGILQQLIELHSLSTEQSSQLMNAWLTDSISPAVSGAILTALQIKGVSDTELLGMIQVLRSQITLNQPRSYSVPVIDTCGTGGDGASTFNISTAAAFVTAAAGVKVAKHGNRSASSKTGSADVLEYLGVNLAADQRRVEAALDEVGITFLFSQNWHPGFKAVASLRKILKIRTVFNVLGPLLNPLQPTGQVVGVSSPTLLRVVASTLSKLPVRKAIVVYGRERLDEAGLGDLSDLAQVDCQQVRITSINPQLLGLTPASTGALRGGDAQVNAKILKTILQGGGTQSQRDVVALNEALALQVGEAIDENSNETVTLIEGIKVAKEILDSGAAWVKLEQLSTFLA
jgi:anthranilate phosphoribosyltransferase